MEKHDPDLFGRRIVVVNVGLKSFGDALKEQGVEVAQVEWKPVLGKKTRVLLEKVL